MLGAFFSGVFTMGLAGVAMIFWGSWKATGERFFFRFCIAFVLMAAERLVLAVFDNMAEPGNLVYLFRLAGYLVILYAIYLQTYSQSKSNTKERRLHLVVDESERKSVLKANVRHT